MNTTTDHFYLVSNASTGTYRNSLTRFTNHFGQTPLTFNSQDKYQIGLTDIFLHPRYSNIPILPSSVPHIRLYLKSNIYKTAQQHEVPHRIYNYTPCTPIDIPYKKYTPISLIESIDDCLKAIPPYPGSSRIPIAFNIAENGQTFTIKTLPFRVTSEVVIRNNNQPTTQNIIDVVDEFFIWFHHKIAITLGLLDANGKLKDTKNMTSRVINNELYYGYFKNPSKDETLINYKVEDLFNNIPKIIKVEINHVQPIAVNNSYAHILAYHTLNMVNSHLHYMQFDHPLYLTLTSSHINEFTVRLLDENNNQLKLDASLPTILKMNIRKYDEISGEFNIIIDSTKKNPDYPDNTGNDFCINLVPPIQLDDDYICSINSITYATFFKTLPIPSNESYIKVIKPVVQSLPSLVPGSTQTLHTTIEFVAPFNPLKKPLFSIQDVLTVLNECCKVPDDYPNASKFQHSALDKGCASFALVTLPSGKSLVNVGGFLNTTYDLPYELITVLGEIKNNENENKNRWVFQLDEKIPGLPNFGKRSFVHPPDIISLIPQTLWIYTDFIQPIQVGDGQANLLQIVPVKSDNIDSNRNKYLTETIERPHWSQIRTRTLDKLRFKILRSDGRPIGFEKPEDGVIISLTFKKLPQQTRNNMFYFS